MLLLKRTPAGAATPAGVSPWCTHHFTWEYRPAQPYVSRGPRPSRTRHWPGWRGAAGPRTLTRRTAPSPSSALSLRTSPPPTTRTSLAHPLEPPATVTPPPPHPSA